MDKFQRDTPVNSALPTALFRKGNGYGFYLIWIVAISVSFSVACDNEPNDADCLQIPISVWEGESVDVPLNQPIRDLCLWSNSSSRWENACHFSQGLCRTLLTHFKEDVSIKGNRFVLKNVSIKASGIYKLLDKPGSCVVSMRISVLSARPTTPSSRSGTFHIRLEKWSGVTWVCSLLSIPILAILNYL